MDCIANKLTDQMKHLFKYIDKQHTGVMGQTLYTNRFSYERCSTLSGLRSMTVPLA